ncbi:disulfide bond formation protein DsbA [Patescibacteria group bacterium]|nr:MAG: disulfide bond formation protein DsbA [Patescibacteria group bacterium]
MDKETKVIIGVVIACIVLFVGGAMWYNSATKPVSVDVSRLVHENSPQIQAPGARVTIVEFADFECPGCAGMHPVLKKILTDYSGKVNFVYRTLPIHRDSTLAAKFALAAGEQGNYWQMHDMLYDNQSVWAGKENPPKDIFLGYAKELKLDLVKLEKSMSDGHLEAQINADRDDALKIGVRGTPTLFINGSMLQGVPSDGELRARIEAILVR